MATVLNIAFISFEYPPDTGGGGIGTYTQQVANLLILKGHKVSVFCGTANINYCQQLNGVSFYRIQSQNTDQFRVKVVDIFNTIHTVYPFDLIESPDYGADGYLLKKQHPTLPYVIKLHTPTYLIKFYNCFYSQYILPNSYFTRLKRIVRGISKVQDQEDVEYQNIKLATIILSPSIALAKRIVRDWNVSRSHIHIIPNFYQPTNDQLSVVPQFNLKRVTFIGKLSILKGAVDLPLIIQLVLSKMTDIIFRFIGDDSFSPDPNLTMKEYILKKCKLHEDNLEFLGKVPLYKINTILAETDIVLCISLWENYPTVVLEAMSAGRVVIGTNTGGISEIIKHGHNGILVPVKAPKKVADKIINCYQYPERMKHLGENARSFITNVMSAEHISNKIISSYIQAIES